jgi:hypothetical protein
LPSPRWRPSVWSAVGGIVAFASGWLLGWLSRLSCHSGYRLASGKLGYAFLHEHVPGWRGIRVPARLMTLTTLGLALLAAAGADRALEGLGHRRRFPGSSGQRLVVASLLVVAILLEGAGRIPTSVPPREPRGLADLPSPQLHLPVEWTPLFMFWSSE